MSAQQQILAIAEALAKPKSALYFCNHLGIDPAATLIAT